MNDSYIGIRLDLLKFIEGSNLTVLDLGCATGANGQYLKENGLADHVIGVEFDTDMALLAEKNYDKVIVGDLEYKTTLNQLEALNLDFDIILCGDILEHLKNTESILLFLKKILSSEGKIIVSLPNVRHIETLIQLYFKKTWPRNDRGIFDRTHLRWFTKKDCEELFRSTGYHIDKYERTLRARDKIGSTFDWKLRLLSRLDKDLVTFQHRFVLSHEH
ncbi:class I SAM-dependent methyltransferase [Croceiramulus getboli]|nr:class I SAM-dependent methyltransferase [Flavobacteriaceae bacterium YJPT1-3]